MVLFNLLVKICWLVFMVVWVVFSFKAKRNIYINNKRQSSFVRIVIIVLVISFLKIKIFRQLDNTNIFSSNYFIQGCGVLICAAGIAFAIWARIHLGKNWGMPMSLKKEPELITTGPYKFIRHPIYTGLCIAMTGSFLAEGSRWFVWLIFMGGYFIYSAKKEEKFMLLQFPDQYSEYMKRTKMLLPFIF
jgi:protein-S-isoprenylcysteine O-methyltransferase Ste14